MHIKINDKTLLQFLKFALVGCSNSIVTLVGYYICIGLFGKEFYLLGQTTGYVAAVINSFFWNSRYVFRSVQISKARAFLKICFCNVVIYAMQVLLLYCFVDILNVSERISPILAILITLPINFTLNKIFVFK